MRRILTSNNILTDDDLAQDKDRVIAYAKEILGGQRGSVMGKESQKKLSRLRRKYATRNEATWFHRMWWALVRDHRSCREGDLLDPPADLSWFVQEWDVDFLDCNLDQPFRTDSVPRLDTEDMDSMPKNLLKLYPRVADPKPNAAYGIAEDGFTKDHGKVNWRYTGCTEISPGIFHTFFVVVATKNASGTRVDAENQAARGGSSMELGMNNLSDVVKDLQKAVEISKAIFGGPAGHDGCS